MPIKVLMPALSPTMKEGNLAKWHIKEGDQVSPGDLIAEIETDKATMEVEAVEEGKVGKILVKEGSQNVKVNSVIALLLEEGEDKDALKNLSDIQSEDASNSADDNKENAESSFKKDADNQQEKTSKNEKKFIESQKSELQSHQDIPIENNRIFVTPLAKRLAVEKNIDLKQMKGSGPRGRIIKEDVLNYSTANNKGFAAEIIMRTQPETSEMPISTMRRVIAQRLLESKQNIPHFYLSIDCNMDKLLEFRKDINDLARKESPEFKVSVNDIITKASALALKEVPEANASWGDNSIINYNNIDISIAVAIEGGLITPIVKNTDQKSLFEISSEIKELVRKAKAGSLAPNEFQGGSFSISNLGMYGIKQFNAIINPPQSCILSVGTTTELPIVKNGEIKISNIMTLTISCDHRVVDGAVGAKLLNAIKKIIENPVRMLI